MRKLLTIVFCLSLFTLFFTACGMNEDTTRTTKPEGESTDTAEKTETEVTQVEKTTAQKTTDAEASPTVQKISAEEAWQMMQQEQVIVVDVRRQDEYNSGHIEGALLLPNETITLDAEEILTDKNVVILVYCRSGRRSAEAAEKLLRLGYTKIYDFGGILDWPYQTVTEP